jgi:hypothetical protein
LNFEGWLMSEIRHLVSLLAGAMVAVAASPGLAATTDQTTTRTTVGSLFDSWREADKIKSDRLSQPNFESVTPPSGRLVRPNTLLASLRYTRRGCEDGTSTSNSIVVCGFRGPSPYRIIEPEGAFAPDGNRASVASERSRWAEGGEVGTGSCGPVGPGGWTGCMAKGWRAGRQQRGWYQ